jgi:hypothetical protein
MANFPKNILWLDRDEKLGNNKGVQLRMLRLNLRLKFLIQ